MRKPCVIGKRCEYHAFVHGAEAEELREELERFAETEVGGDGNWARIILDKVDARDSAAFVEMRRHQGKREVR